jgi:spore maturation protein CgeB
LKIAYVALKHDYGLPERGLSFEHYNFFETLVRMGHDIVYFDFMTIMRDVGREAMNKRLFDVVKSERPDLMFAFLFTDELDPTVVRRISRRTGTVTLNWFADDHWRFETFSRRWAPNFNWVVTTASDAVPKYEAAGYRNAIKSQWACNHFLYRKLDAPPRYDVTFVGQPHGTRRETIDALRDAGLDVRVWGHGWESGRLSQEEMIRVFNESRINLNLSNAYRAPERPPTLRESISQRAQRSTSGRLAKRALKPFVQPLIRSAAVPVRSAEDGSSAAASVPDQIKGRNFEIPGCGGFLITGRADDLERYYDPGEEIACFDSTEGLIAKVFYYLEHDHERERVARRGYERTLGEHTYVHRFQDIFRRIGIDDSLRDRRAEVMEVNR